MSVSFHLPGYGEAPKEIKDRFPKKLEALTQVLKTNPDLERGSYTFLGMGVLTFEHDFTIEKVGSMESRLVGSDHNKVLKREGVKKGGIYGEVPKEATHYFLGEGHTEQELYIKKPENSFSRDIFPIAFLR